ncbi:MAG TPA: NAD(P)H-binding protein [Marmoricola sp.]|nr:NAD(P)H-binding protein [Marmoricola sp.]
MRTAIFGANGPTGRLLTQQALDAGHHVVAATRQPEAMPIAHPRLEVERADVHDPAAVSAVVDGCDAVLSTLGVPYTREPITVYSAGARHLVEAMHEHRVKRLVVVSSSATYPHRHAEGGFLLNRVLQPIITRTIGRTTYADMRRMEELVRASDLAWTIVRPSGLFDRDTVSAYQVHEDESPGIFTARIDLAAAMLAELEADAHVGQAIAVTTHEGTPTLWQMLRAEAGSKE